MTMRSDEIPSDRDEDKATAVSRCAFLAQPYALLYGMFLLLMASLSFAIPSIHDVSILLRWPALGTIAVLGVGMWLASSRSWMTEHWSILGFIVLAALSAGYADDAKYTLARTASILLLFGATFLGLHSYCRTLDRALAVTDVWWLIGVLLVIGGFAFRQMAPSISGRYEGLHDRATGAGTYAALFLPIAIYQVRYRLTGFWQGIGWLILGLLLLQLLLTGARAALLTTALISMVLWFDYYGRKAMIGFLLLAILAPLPILLDAEKATALEERSQRLLRRESLFNFTGRLDRWRFGLEQFVRSPIYGQGFGASRTLASMEEPRRFRVQPGDVVNLHSDQIEVLADLGLVGYCGFAMFWIAVGLHGLRTFLAPQCARRQLALAYFGGVTYAFMDTFMHGGFLSAGGGVSTFTWSMIACFLAVRAPSAIPEAFLPGQSNETQPARRAAPSASPIDRSSGSVRRRTAAPRASLPTARAVLRRSSSS